MLAPRSAPVSQSAKVEGMVAEGLRGAYMARKASRMRCGRLRLG
jgi:hypothetical protein